MGREIPGTRMARLIFDSLLACLLVLRIFVERVECGSDILVPASRTSPWGWMCDMDGTCQPSSLDEDRMD